MIMNKEFIPYKQALALKKLGFDEDCFAMWQKNKRLWFSNKNKWITNFVINPDKELIEFHSQQYPNNVMLIDGKYKLLSCSNFTAPLYQQAFRWFREKHDLQCWFHDGGILGKTFIKITGYKHDKFYFSSSEPMEYEEAEQACLEKLMEIVKNK